VETGREEGGCKGGGAGGEGWIVIIVVIINGDVDGNSGRRCPQTATRLLLPREDGGGDGS
jgi:hypothetical protein